MKRTKQRLKTSKSSTRMATISKSYIAADFYGSMNKSIKRMSDSLYIRVMRGLANGR